mgnify:CR=1 FL=1
MQKKREAKQLAKRKGQAANTNNEDKEKAKRLRELKKQAAAINNEKKKLTDKKVYSEERNPARLLLDEWAEVNAFKLLEHKACKIEE